jgi:drug/metabolite transporter (DMT)-like permease
MPAPRRVALAVLLVSALALAWGCNWPSMKLVLTGLDPWLFRLCTGVGGGLIFLTLLRLRGISLAVPQRQWGPLALIAMFNMAIFPTSSILALQYLPAGWTALIAYTMPVWAALISSVVFKERVTLRRVLALVLGLVGLVVLLAPRLDGSANIAAGVPIILTGAVLWAVGVVAQKQVNWSRPVAVITAWQILLGGLPFVVVSAVVSDFASFAAMPIGAVLALAYSVLIGLVAGSYLFYRMVHLFPVAVAGVASLAVPVVGVLSSVVLLGEAIGLGEIAAMGLVVSAIALVLFERRPATTGPAKAD